MINLPIEIVNLVLELLDDEELNNLLILCSYLYEIVSHFRYLNKRMIIQIFIFDSNIEFIKRTLNVKSDIYINGLLNFYKFSVLLSPYLKRLLKEIHIVCDLIVINGLNYEKKRHFNINLNYLIEFIKDLLLFQNVSFCSNFIKI